MLIDCSAEAQAELRRQRDELRAKRYSGVSSVSDRSRSVSYDHELIAASIAEIEGKLAFCAGCRRASRLSYNPLVKAL